MRLTLLALIPALGLIACGSPDEIATTNSGNVVLNDAQANYAFENDNEGPLQVQREEQMNIANAMADGNAMDGNMADPMMGNMM
ncbi:hypothetical protein [Sphingomonas baiyangensis]|uniref:Uncharacterized protein n=1 Tax=Sphingomonas baiyangensis TaxID=2572576 RepID=A0A4U1L9C8_9SPHN|nr:hypothetical protein [Sphingomonas baiyangensis]TKD52980.1 hypothetical protein FBR43_01135 [Sphingomonas baiyangensis]